MKNGVMGKCRAAAAAVFTVGLSLLGGCANQQQLDMALDENRSLKNSMNELQSVNGQLKTENEMLQKGRVSNEALLAQYKDMNDDLRKKLEAAGVSLRDLDERLKGLAFGPIDRETDQMLRQLAEQYPDLIKYDSDRGMLRFASDLTFDSGQDVVKPGAAQSLNQLGKILGSNSARAYEVMIVGHTDAQPIGQASRGRGHPTNMHLSCHRAIAVRNALQKDGVPANKMFAAGWGEERPIAANGKNGASEQNRRVEIFLTRPTGTPMPVNAPSTATAPTTDATPARQPDMTK